MKKTICLCLSLIGCLWGLFWIAIYACLFQKNSTTYENLIALIMLINFVLVVFEILLGGCFIKISIDQWFPGGEDDFMTKKDKCLVIIAFAITLLCIGLFISTILYNNINSVRVEALDNIKLQMLMFILANTYAAFYYFQCFQVFRSKS